MEHKLNVIPFNESGGSSLMTVLSTLLLFFATLFCASYDALKIHQPTLPSPQCPGFIIILPEAKETDIHHFDDALKEFFLELPDVLDYQVVSDSKSFAELGLQNTSGSYIDVQMVPNATISQTRLVADLDQIIPGVQAVDRIALLQHKQFERNLLSTSIFCLAGVMIFSVIVIAAFLTRSQYRHHSGIIDILQYLGASHRYISSKFQKHFFQKVIKGGLFGMIPAFFVLLLIGFLLIDAGVFGTWIFQQLKNICVILALAVGSVLLTVKMIVSLLMRHSHSG